MKTKPAFVRPASLLALVALASATVVAMVSCGESSDAGTGASVAAAPENRGKSFYVDTHDHYDHAGKNTVVDPQKFNYFKLVGGKPSIALTFDCAWVDSSNGLSIIKFLRDNKIKTTFFISGPFIFNKERLGSGGGVANLNQASFKMIRQMIEDGHEFGNHTQTHPHNLSEAEQAMQDNNHSYEGNSTIQWGTEVSDLEVGWNMALKEIYGIKVPPNAIMKPFWRAPYGEYNRRSLKQAAVAGFPLHFGWNIDARDSVGFPACKVDPTNPKCLSPAKMTQDVIDFGALNKWKLNGTVVLAHLQNPYDWAKPVDGLQRLVDTYRSKGIEFRRLSEMFNHDLAPDVKYGTVEFSTIPVPPAKPESGEATTNTQTWLKVSTADSAALTAGTQKCILPAGTVLKYASRVAEGSHARLTLKELPSACASFPTKDVYVFTQHATFVAK